MIAEIGSNHNQELSRAFELIDIAKESGADAVKFQSINLERLIDKKDITEDTRELFHYIELNEDWYEELFSYARKREIECISSPTYLESIPLLVRCGASYMKIASPQTYGFPELIKRVAKTGLPTIMSTGYCNDNEIERAVQYFNKNGDRDNLTLLHCISQYPTEIEKVNLLYIKRLQEKYQIPVGLSDHTKGISVAIGAAAIGAQVIEKHITISKKDVGPDHFFALEPDEFAKMVSGIREIELALGEGNKELTIFEKEYRDSLIMYPYANRKIKAGQTIKEEDIKYYRSKDKGISPWDVEEKLIGNKMSSDVEKDHKII